jgi:tRNA (guanine-N7-)-methyltransferase
MAQKKLIRFAAIKTFANVLEYPENMKGKWAAHFNNSNPIVLELACGRGEYTVELAQMYANKNFVGVDVKGNRMFIGAKKCLDQQLTNAAFLRTQIALLTKYFDAAEVSEIWITFPDPQLRSSKAKKRLTHPQFLQLYQQLLQPGGSIHLKTDSPKLYAFTKIVIELYQLQLVEDIPDVYAISNRQDLFIKTHYESLDIANSKKIFYLHFKHTDKIDFTDKNVQETLKEAEKDLPQS